MKIDILTEIRRLKAQRETKGDLILDSIENPLPRFEKVFREVQTERERVMKDMGVSCAELVDYAYRVDPALTDTIMHLFEEIDNDIYGRYIDGTLTLEELEEYYKKLDQWKSLSLQLFKLLSDRKMQ